VDLPSGGEPTFRVVVLFHRDLELLRRTLPRCLEALTAGTRETFEVVIRADGTPPDVARNLLELAAGHPVDEVQLRGRDRFVASGAPGNNSHRRLFDTSCRYLVSVEEDVVLYRTERGFDVLRAIREVFEEHREVCALSRMDDTDQWCWELCDVGPAVEPGVRSVNRVATHWTAYDVPRFRAAAAPLGAFHPEVFIDRDDRSHNWEDVVSYVATTGGRRIAWPEGWPLRAFHCDRKVEPGSMYHTQDLGVRLEVLDDLERRFAGDAR